MGRQGGALAVAAGLTYSQRLGGIASVSGWCPCKREQLEVHPANSGVPLFFSCGTGDPIVDYRLAKYSSEILGEMLVGSELLRVEVVQRTTHAARRGELQKLEEFLKECIAIGKEHCAE
ncbi:MAG: hypothetical protein SGPRY_012177 [Prymnesium sp.]